MTSLASTGMSGWDNTGIGAEFFRGSKALDLINFTADHCSQGCSDPWNAKQMLMHRFCLKLGPDPFFLRLHLLCNQIVQG